MEKQGTQRNLGRLTADSAVCGVKFRAIVLALSLGSSLLIAQAAATAQSSKARSQPTPQASPSPPQPASTPLSDIVWRIESLALTLRDVTGRLDSNRDVAAIIQFESAEHEEIQAKAQETVQTLAGAPTIGELGELDAYWRQVLGAIPPRQRTLARREATIAADLALMTEEQKYWKSILAQTTRTEANEAIYTQIHDALKKIETLIKRIDDGQRALSEIQVRLAAENVTATGLGDRISRERQQFQRRLLEHDSLPIWKFRLRRESRETVENVARGPDRWFPILTTDFRQEHAWPIAASGLVFFSMLALSLSLRRPPMVPTWSSALQSPASDALQHPLAFAFLVSLVFASTLTLFLPASLSRLISLALVIPVVRFVTPLVGAHWRILLYLLAGSFTWTLLKYTFIPPSSLRREVEAVLITGLIVAFFAITLRRSFRLAVSETRWSRVAIRLARVLISIMAMTLVANVLGYMRFAQVFTRATVVSAFYAVVLFLMVRLFVEVLTAILKTDRARKLATVRLRENVIIKWVEGLLATAAVLFWIAVASELFMVREQVGRLLTAILTFRITLGTLDFSVGNIMTVAIVLCLGFAFSTATRFVVREEVLARVRLSRGLPELITTLLYYGLIVIVIVMAFGAAGVEFSRLTLITGALGVGIGFGLQNIVNNFVSGLILQVERPIHIGDILEVAGLTGEVTRIGARSSTIQTALGAEVIVPNADLVAGRVINWTLSSERRRVDIPVSVVVTSDPKRVMEILKGAANANPCVVQDPAPLVLFQGVGEAGLNFILQFWAPDRSSYPQLSSEVGVSMVDALKANGIELTASQRGFLFDMIEKVAMDRASKTPVSKDGETATGQKP